MNSTRSAFRTLPVAVVLALVALRTTASAQGQMAAPAAPAAVATQARSICGSQQSCSETPDFAATVTDFRTSMVGAQKVIDATIRFQNKTNNSLVLGYAIGSGMALDDRGLRYSVAGPNALRGMGVVNGRSFDPKFVLQPGGYGDARFELMTGGSQVYGLTYELNITINEINTLEGNQHTLGGEFPLQFQGLTNGVRGVASGLPAGDVGATSGGTPSPCPAGMVPVQNAANTATSTVSNAATAISSFASMFGQNKQAAPAGTGAATIQCVPANQAGAAPVSASAPAANPPAHTTGTGGASVAGGARAVTPAAVTPAAVTPAAGTVKAAAVKAPKTPAQVKSPATSTVPAQKTAPPQQ